MRLINMMMDLYVGVGNSNFSRYYRTPTVYPAGELDLEQRLKYV